MDDLPSDIVLKILSLLSGNDVGRFKLLSKNIRDVIHTNRGKFKYPEVVFGLSDCAQDENNVQQKKIQLEISYEKCYGKRIIDYKNPIFIVVFPSEGMAWRHFLAPLLAGDTEFKRKGSLRKALDFVLKKIEAVNSNESRRSSSSDESGTRAAAVTWTGLKMSSGGPDPTPTEFKANRPFIYVLSHKNHVIFTGQYCGS